MFRVKYVDEATGYEWYANFETEEEALAQAATDTHVYGGELAQEVLDGDTVVNDQAAILEEAEKLDGS